ncbi:MAG TPA: sepiapterin reductase [Planctomycetaceae bacterium]|nr:sepiapterin reductase [Planctomycetaceae bacterium]
MQAPPIYVVTGATRGIGRSVAAVLAERGLRVVAVGRSDDLLASLRESCGPELTTVQADLTTDAGVQKVADSIPLASVTGMSAIAGIVHSAGSLVPLEPYAEIDTAKLQQHFCIHVAAPMKLFQTINQNHSIKRMLFIDSYSASTARVGWSAYSIVKSAAQMAARCAAQELSSTRTIRAYPGAVKTQIVDEVLASDTETAGVFARLMENGEVAEPNDVAKFLVALLVDAPDELLDAQDSFDYNNPTDRKNAEQL